MPEPMSDSLPATAAAYPHIDGTQPCREVDPDLFFPDVGGAGLEAWLLRTVIGICQSCPFMDDCLGYALTHNVTGIWGGTTHLRRKQMRRQFGITATEPATGLDELLGISA